MAKQIALNLTINGVKQSVSNINDLEKAISQAEETLKGLDIGSETFKQLTKDVNGARSVLKDFEKSFEGQELEQRVGAFAAVGESITASFAGAQAAFSLFGAESESIAEAAAKAQSLLTIALTARSVAEGVVQLRTVAQTIATYASAQAAVAATTATRTLYATLAANPYGAILAVIGLIVSALVAFTQETQKAVDVSAELSKVQSEEANKLKNTLTVLTQFNTLRNLQAKSLSELVKEYPGFNAFIDKENKLNAAGVEFLKLKIKQYEIEAQTKLILQKIAENNIKILEIEQSSAVETVSVWQRLGNIVRTGGNVSQQALLDLQAGLQNQREEITKVNAENEKWRAELNKTYKEYDVLLGQIKPYNEQLAASEKATKEAEQAEKDAIQTKKQLEQSYKDGRNAIISFQEQLKGLDKLQKQYADTIDRLNQVDYTSKIIEDLNAIKEARKTGVEELLKYENDFKKVINELSKPLPADLFLGTFKAVRDELETVFLAFGSSAEKLQQYNAVLQKALSQNTDLTQQQREALTTLVEGYRQFDTTISGIKGFRQIIDTFPEFDAAFDDFRKGGEVAQKSALGFLLALGDITAAVGEFKLEQNELGQITEFPFDVAKARKNAADTLTLIRKGLLEPLARDFLEQEKKGLGLGLQRKDLTDVEKAALKGKLDRVNELLKSQKIDFTLLKPEEVQKIEEGVNISIEAFRELLSEIVKAEQGIFKISAEVNKLTKELTDNPEKLSKAIGGVVLANIDAISQLLIGVRTEEQKIEKEFVDKVKADRKGLETFKETLIKKGIDVEKASYDDLLAAYIEYKKREKVVTDKAEKDKRDAQQKTFNDILQGIQLFSNTINQVSALTRERVETDLQLLQVAEKTALEQVVGDTEQANNKRLELQAEYEQKRKQIEKQGRITSLQFSIFQTIANSAQAVVKSLAELGPIAGPIFAAVNAAIGVAQLAIIQDQISAARSMRRGGLVRAQGGLLVGPSHEMGGIMIPNMGVVAEGNESIINRQSTLQYQDLLSSVNMAGGGKPLVYNSFDDSRIVEALAKQNSKPLRAYVLSSDITNEQAINQRLDDLSKL